MCDGVYQLVFLSPEALLSNETWRDTVPSPVYQENLVAVVIDEFYQHSCHVTLGSNVTNYIPLWNENLAHVTRRIFPSLPPPPFPRACAPRGKIRMACETRLAFHPRRACAARVTVVVLCVCVCAVYSRTTGYEAAYERYQQLQFYKSKKYNVAILLKRLRSKDIVKTSEKANMPSPSINGGHAYNN